MVPRSWAYVMVSGSLGIVPEFVRDVLGAEACNLRLKKRDTISFKRTDISGVLTTDWTTRTIGAVTGVLFRSEIYIRGKKARVNFLLNAQDLERGSKRLRKKFDENGFGHDYIGLGELPVAELFDTSDLFQPQSTVRH